MLIYLYLLILTLGIAFLVNKLLNYWQDSIMADHSTKAEYVTQVILNDIIIVLTFITGVLIFTRIYFYLDPNLTAGLTSQEQYKIGLIMISLPKIQNNLIVFGLLTFAADLIVTVCFAIHNAKILSDEMTKKLKHKEGKKQAVKEKESKNNEIYD